MKKVSLLFLLLVSLLVTAAPVAAQSKEKLEVRLREAATNLESVAISDEGRIPGEILQKASGIIVLHQYKGGFIVGGKGGFGVAMVRDDKGNWSAPAFLMAGEGSFGLQVGVQVSDYVFLIMNDEGMKLLSEPSFRIGVDAAATAGPHNIEGEAKIGATPILVYSTSSGLFAGAAFEGGALLPDEKANHVLYGDTTLTMKDILFGNKVTQPVSARPLVNTIGRFERR